MPPHENRWVPASTDGTVQRWYASAVDTPGGGTASTWGLLAVSTQGAGPLASAVLTDGVRAACLAHTPDARASVTKYSCEMHYARKTVSGNRGCDQQVLPWAPIQLWKAPPSGCHAPGNCFKGSNTSEGNL